MIGVLLVFYFFGDDRPTRIRDRTAWSATATHHPGAASLAFDGDLQTRWTTQQPLEPGMFFQVDLGWKHRIVRAELPLAAWPADFPRDYQIAVSTNGEEWEIADTRGNLALTPPAEITIHFRPVVARYLKIIQTGTTAYGHWWSIPELELYALPRFQGIPGGLWLLVVLVGFAAGSLYLHPAIQSRFDRTTYHTLGVHGTLIAALILLLWLHESVMTIRSERITDTEGWTASTSSNPEDVRLAFDGWHETHWDSQMPMHPGMVYQLDLGTEHRLTHIFLNARTVFHAPRGYRIAVSSDRQTWRTVAASNEVVAAIRTSFPPVSARYITILQTGTTTNDQTWAIHELQVEAASTPDPLLQFGIFGLVGGFLIGCYVHRSTRSLILNLFRQASPYMTCFLVIGLISAGGALGGYLWLRSLPSDVGASLAFSAGWHDTPLTLMLVWRVVLYSVVLVLLAGLISPFFKSLKQFSFPFSLHSLHGRFSDLLNSAEVLSRRLIHRIWQSTLLRWGLFGGYATLALLWYLRAHHGFPEALSAPWLSWVFWGIFSSTGCVLLVILILNQEPVYAHLRQMPFFRGFLGKIRAHAGWVKPLRTSLGLHAALLLLLSLLIIYNHLGERSLVGADEGIHTRVANRIVTTGVWWPLEYRGQPYTHKPPLKLWVSALTFKYVGKTEFWVRFWDASFATGTIWLIYLLGRAMFTPFAGLMGGTILVLSRNFLYNHCARTGVQDSAMIFFFTLALVFFWFRRRHPAYYYLAGLAMSCSSLTKNWMGLGPLLIIVVYLVFSRQFREFTHPPLYIMSGMSLLVPLLWFLPNLLVVPGFFERSFLNNMLGRLTGTTHSDFTQGPGYYLEILYHYFQPWVWLIPLAIVFGLSAIICRNHRGFLYLFVWIGVVFGGFSTAQLKLGWYINPVFPPLALAIGATIAGTAQTLRRTLGRQAPLVIAGFAGLMLYLFLSAFFTLYQRSTRDRERYPIQQVVTYLEDRFENALYQVVLYQLDEDRDLNDQEHYYLHRLPTPLRHAETPQELQEMIESASTPLFILLRSDVRSADPLLHAHPAAYRIPMTDPVPKTVLLYHWADQDFPLVHTSR
ncbi:hypothetical protein GF339_15005 [candidate division KSB3 bacterium]|uniref:F5/8 type C domain-containing protein n=1 Tax=candidate division KSB3 bacterium TaxID=2044937 RepID=A0A9D5JXC8_9BACT|nr:hypothetical protein [candidate division KSB3 bacterium]MBD3325893.1 hypothetical protein [candidate division KSB3 bacterium]